MTRFHSAQNRLIFVLITWCVLVIATASKAEEAWPLAPDHGWQEVVVITTDLYRTRQDFIEVGGWTEVTSGDVDPRLLLAWTGNTDVSARETIIQNPGKPKGLIRLVQIDGIAQKHIRPAGQTWDTGGIFDIGLRVIDIEEKFRQLLDRGWHAYSAPVTFEFGKFRVSEVLMQGPDGLVVALIERQAPPLTGWPNLKKFSHTFNATSIVKDAEAARAYLADKLGFKIYIESDNKTPPEGPNVLGLPHNINATSPRLVYIMHPDGTNDGSVEILEYRNTTGRDFSEAAQPPNIGLSVLRFPVSDIETKAKDLQDKGISLSIPITEVTLAPYGPVKFFAFKTDFGAWFEYFEPAP